MRWTARLISYAAVILLATGAANAQPVTAALDYGPYGVGFRALTELDHSRAVRARTTFSGQAVSGETAMPIEIGLWYPAGAAPGAARMTAEAYKALRNPQPRTAAVSDFARMASFGGLQISADEAADALTRPTHAVRDAPPAAGRFPLVVSGAYLGASWIRAEYLASHGYVVIAVPSADRTATLEATQPEIALETQTRNLEFAYSFARLQPFVDDTRVGVLGVNFDGMAAILFQMRNMTARAVVSIDGYEAKAGNVAMLTASPFFDPVRMRVPYLVFVQNERDPPPSLAHDRTVWNALPYSARFWYVLKGFNHAQLISDVANAGTLSRDEQAGHVFILRTIRRFLDANVKLDASAQAALVRPAQENGLPAALALVADNAPSLPAAPTSEEFEQLVMGGQIAEAARVYRDARRANPALRLFDENTINLYAFRYSQRQLRKEALEIRRLCVEAFPQSQPAAYQLGVAASDAGNAAEARAAFSQALQLLEAGTSPPSRKEELRREIQKRMAALDQQH